MPAVNYFPSDTGKVEIGFINIPYLFYRFPALELLDSFINIRTAAGCIPVQRYFPCQRVFESKPVASNEITITP